MQPTLAGVADVPNVRSDRMLRRAGFDVPGEVPEPRHALRTYLWQATGAAVPWAMRSEGARV